KQRELDRMNDLELQERKFKHDIEMIERKKQSFIEQTDYVEKVRTDRKEKRVILNINIINNNYKQYIYNNYKDNNDMSTLRDTMETGYQSMINTVSYKSEDILLRLVKKQDSYEQLFANIIAHCYSNPTSQSLFYFKNLSKFYGIYLDKQYKAYKIVEEVEFDKEVLPIFHEFMIKFIDYISNNIL